MNDDVSCVHRCAPAARAIRGWFPAVRAPALLAALAALVSACAGNPVPQAGPPVSEPPPMNHRFLALGDSYTIGEKVDSAARWPVQLAALVRDRGIPLEDPRIIARTGWTTDELSAAIDQARLDEPYGLVTLLIGVNNQYRGRPAGEYRAQFDELLRRAIVFAGGVPGHVLVLSIPDWGVTPFAEGRDRGDIARQIDAFNRINRDETERIGARYVDVTPVSRKEGLLPAMVAGDGLHPSGAMYAEWAKLALPEALKALGGP